MHPSLSNSAMSCLSSVQFFEERCKVCGFTQEQVTKLASQGWNTLGKFAFAVPSGNTDDEQLIANVVIPVFGEGPPRALVAMVRRLHLEAYTYAVSDMRLRVERTDEDPPRKMPRVERESRVDAIRDRLGKSFIHEERVPASQVVDFFNACAEEGVLKYMPWQRIVSLKFASKEASRQIASKEWKPNKGGVVTERTVEQPTSQEVGLDLYRLEHVLIRRAVAMEAAKLLPFEIAMKASSVWFEAMEDDPADPSLYAKTSIAQVAKADAELFTAVARLCNNGVIQAPDGSYPMTVHWEATLKNARIQQILVPMPKVTEKRESTQNWNSQFRAPPPPTSQDYRRSDPKGKGKSKDKSKAKGKDRDGPKPRELLHCVSRTPAGENICFGFNLPRGCPNGADCPRGKHVCARPGCFQNHSQVDHKE